MRSHGWSGNTPSSDQEAIDRILDAADRIVAERGTALRLADVARSLGVTRQTVYRYFPGTEALMIASAMRSAHGFLDQLAQHLGGLTDPVDALVEGVAFAVESLAEDRRLADLLNSRARDGKVVSLTSDTARTFSRSLLQRLDVDWSKHGFDGPALDELAEIGLRTTQSLLLDPGDRHNDGAALRRFIAGWIGPAIAYPRIAEAMSALRERL
ncbi:TetR family transcriptional regulator [Mycolicibacter engbaekii]|uniref:TetR family transcriptional regulator n=1 Tax=Mycolicibacter engbaekii TaxID=188915 RepID=A0A1X1TMA8_9MYCO|nr:TetR/AcrR family transcriptional regulator [Mycolicibacter engbaekii]ORV45725.1 TetR family transcriptional regulator [Mycolicibacter engbaekii]